MPNYMTASGSQKEHDVHCLSASWPWLLVPKLFQRCQRLTDLMRLVSRGLIRKLRPLWVSAVKCSPVSHTDTLMFALSTTGCSAMPWKKKKKPAVCEKLSPCLVLCSQAELDEYSHGENACGIQHQQRCLASCIYWFFVILVCFSIQSLGWIHSWQTSTGIWIWRTMLCALLVPSYVTNAHGPHGFLLCIRTACLCVMCLLLWKGRRLAVCLLPSSWNLSVPLGSWAQVYRTAEAALTARLISFGARHAALLLAAWTGFVPFLPLYIHKLYI